MYPQYSNPRMRRMRPRRQRRSPAFLVLGIVGLISGLLLIGGSVAGLVMPRLLHSGSSASGSNHAATSPSVHYPPMTVADLHGLAAKGEASAIHEFHSERVGLTGCPQPKQEVRVDPSITGQQLAEDLLAYFYAHQLDSPCGSLVLAYHTQAEATDAYTAGRIAVDTQNTDPNATHTKRTMTLDIGGADTSQQEYTITY